MNNNDTVKFWAYRHVNGRIQVRRYIEQDAIEDAYDSDFVDQVIGPYEAKNRLEAEMIAVERLRVDNSQKMG